MQPFFFFTTSRTPNQKVQLCDKEHFWVRRDEIAAFHFLSRKQSFIQAAHSLPSSLVQEKNKQTNTKMCFPGKCSKITQPLASRTGCRAPRPDCSTGKASSGHESEPVQTGRWIGANYTLRYHPGHQTEAHSCATRERLMQAGTGFNEHWVSLHVLQKRNRQRSRQHDNWNNTPRGRADTAGRGKTGMTPNSTS